MQISRSKIKGADRFIYLGSMVQKKDGILNEINKRIRTASQFYHLIMSIVWNKDIQPIKPQYARRTLRRYYYIQLRHGHALKEKKA
jgi:hypothetical protein